MFVQGKQGGTDLIMIEQAAGVAGILASNGIDAAQMLDGAQGDVGEIPQRSRHHI